MASRVVDGPEKDWLDMTDMAHLTRMSESTIRRLVASGEFPRPKEVSHNVKMWHWTDYLYWTLRVERRDRLVPDPEGQES